MSRLIFLLIGLLIIPVSGSAETIEIELERFYSIEESNKSDAIPNPELWNKPGAPKYIYQSGRKWWCAKREPGEIINKCIAVIAKRGKVDRNKVYSMMDMYNLKRAGKLDEMEAIPCPCLWDKPRSTLYKEWGGRTWQCVTKDEYGGCTGVKVHRE